MGAKREYIIVPLAGLIALALGAGCGVKSKAGAHQESRVVVIAEGEAAGKAGDRPETVEKTALSAAKRNALEQAGEYVTSGSRIDMLNLTEDVVNTWSEGFVRVLEVINKKTESERGSPVYRSLVKIRAEVLLADVEEFKKRYVQEEQADTRTELTFEVYIIAERQLLDGSWEDVLIQDGSLLNTRDRFQIFFKPRENCYLYVINVDAKKNMYTLFPNALARTGNYLKAGEENVLPDRNKFYELDDTTGMETIYFVASYSPMKDIEWLLEKAFEKSDPAGLAVLDQTIRKRGLRGASRIVTGHARVFTLSDGKEIVKAAEMLQGLGSVVKVVRFHHN